MNTEVNAFYLPATVKFGILYYELGGKEFILNYIWNCYLFQQV